MVESESDAHCAYCGRQTVKGGVRIIDGLCPCEPPEHAVEESFFKRKTTDRGFSLLEFEDLYGVRCSIKASSLADAAAIWVGVDDPDPKIMATDAHKIGILTDKNCGWIPYSLPEQVMVNTHMHLTQDQVRQVLPALQHFAETGDLDYGKSGNVVSPVVIIIPAQGALCGEHHILLRGKRVGFVYRAPGQEYDGRCHIYSFDVRPEDLILIGKTVLEVNEEERR